MWRVSTLLSWVKALPADSDLSLKMLTLKVTVLFALSNADRSSDLHSLDLAYRVFTMEGVKFSIPGLTKTTRVGQPPRVVSYNEFKVDPSICPVRALRKYESVTKDLRRPEEGRDPFFCHMLNHLLQ